jgi:hypothetical protein
MIISANNINRLMLTRDTLFFVHVTVHRNKFLFNKTNRPLISQIYFYQETLHISGSSSVHHQEYSTVHLALVYVIKIA